jgi:S-adenosylmethionine:tRNA ribosyltransferase-isomerase
MKRLEIKGVDIEPITLHIGLGSFRPVDVEDLTKHKMDSENYSVTEKTAEMVNEVLDKKKRVCAIGTTTMRTLESSVSANGRLKASSGWTDKFIFPPYEYKICNALLTNFHMPESTLLMMSCAFGGYDLVMDAYKKAIREKYRFLTYGDSMLII